MIYNLKQREYHLFEYILEVRIRLSYVIYYLESGFMLVLNRARFGLEILSHVRFELKTYRQQSGMQTGE